MAERILLIEDDSRLADMILPDMDGLEVCRELRAKSDTPVLMLTARGDAADRIVGLELGADDYLPKPFQPRELLARLRAILRRGKPRARAACSRAKPSWIWSRASRSKPSTARSTCTCRTSARRSSTIPGSRGASSPFAARATSLRRRTTDAAFVSAHLPLGAREPRHNRSGGGTALALVRRPRSRGPCARGGGDACAERAPARGGVEGRAPGRARAAGSGPARRCRALRSRPLAARRGWKTPPRAGRSPRERRLDVPLGQPPDMDGAPGRRPVAR